MTLRTCKSLTITVAAAMALALPLFTVGCSSDDSAKTQPGEYGTLPQGYHAATADPEIAPDSYGQPHGPVGR